MPLPFIKIPMRINQNDQSSLLEIRQRIAKKLTFFEGVDKVRI